MAKVKAAYACKQVLAQATERWPKRKKASDGLLPSAAHQKQNPTSDHDHGNAVDLTDDPKNGPDAHAWALWLSQQGFPEVKYIISNGKIWSTARASEGWRKYNGDNPHDKHVHVSIYAEYRDSKRQWFPAPVEEKEEEEDMTPEQAQKQDEIHAMLKQLTRKREPDKRDVDPNNLSLADLYTLVEKSVKPVEK